MLQDGKIEDEDLQDEGSQNAAHIQRLRKRTVKALLLRR
jgi:hypothetical protein